MNIIITATQPKFKLGTLVQTQGTAEIPGEQLSEALNRYIQGDWGNLDDEDKKSNDAALVDGERLLAVYESSDGTKFWIITEWDRSVTTILLPEEY